jgi:CMP-N-acetylneuraminic acid synthetase
MNRRCFTVAAITSAGVLFGCDTDQKLSATATLLNNKEIQEAMKSLANAIDNLGNAVSCYLVRFALTIILNRLERTCITLSKLV